MRPRNRHRTLARALLIIGCALLASACGDDDDDAGSDGGGDAGTLGDGGGSSDAFVVVKPERPSLPVLTSCPSGWTELVHATGLRYCEPLTAAVCAADQVQIPGEGCARMGDACPAGDWASGFPAGATVRYVRRGAAAGGTGTQAAPFATIAAAISGATSGTIIALDKQSYDETAAVPAGVTLWGACASQSIIAPATGAGPVITAGGAGVKLRNLTLTISGVAIDVPAAASIDVTGLVMPGPSGFRVRAGTLIGAAVAFRSAGGPTLMAAIDVAGGGSAVLTRASITSPAGGRAVHATGAGSRVELVSAVMSNLTGASAMIAVADSASLRLERAVINGAGAAAIGLADGTSAVMADVVIRNIVSGAGAAGVGISAGGQSLTLQRAVVTGCAATALAIAKGTVTLGDVAVIQNPTGGRDGVSLTGGAMLIGRRMLIAYGKNAGLQARGGMVDIEDLSVRDSEELAAGGMRGGQGIFLEDTAATLRRVRVVGSRLVGVQINAGRAVVLDDLEIGSTRERSCVTGSCPEFAGAGYGIGVYGNASAVVTRLFFADSALAGVQVGPTAELDLHQGEITRHPVGANVQNPGLLPARLSDRVLFRGNGSDIDSAAHPQPPAPAAP